ncbi:lysozyme [Aquaspirillum soli]
MSKVRHAVAALVLSASAFVGLLTAEGYRSEAYIPIKGDVPTIGFGTTEGVKLGDKITPVQALARAVADVGQYEGALRRCVKVPLYQHEYDAYISLSYNIGGGAFCGSTLVRKLNASDYVGACEEILRWNKAGGKVLRGLVIRREAEYRQCRGW